MKSRKQQLITEATELRDNLDELLRLRWGKLEGAPETARLVRLVDKADDRRDRRLKAKREANYKKVKQYSRK